MKETRSEPGQHLHRSMRSSHHEPPLRKREKRVNQPLQQDEQYFQATVKIGVSPFDEFVRPFDSLEGLRGQENEQFENIRHKPPPNKRKKMMTIATASSHPSMKWFPDYFQSTKLYEKVPKSYNGEEHFDFLKKMRKVCQGMQYEGVNETEQLLEIKEFQASSSLQEVVQLVNSGNNVLLYGFGAKGFLFPLIIRKMIWAIPDCDIYYMDYTQPFISLKKTLVRMILHQVSIIVEKKYKNNHRKFYPSFIALIEERDHGRAQQLKYSQQDKNKKFLTQIKSLYEKRTHHHVSITGPASSRTLKKKDTLISESFNNEDLEEGEEPELSQISYSPNRRVTRSSRLAGRTEISEVSSQISDGRTSRMSSVIESSSEQEEDDDDEDEEDQLNEKNFWNSHQQPYLQQFAGDLRRKANSVEELKGVLFGVVQLERDLIGRQIMIVNSIDVISSEDELLVGAPRVGPRLRQEDREDLGVLTEIAESGLFTVIGCFQDAFFPLKIGPKVNDLFVLRELHTSELERMNEQLAMLTTKVESEIKGLGYIFKSLTQYQKQLLKLMANHQSDHNGKPISFDKLFDLSINNQLITSKKQLKEALSIPIDQKLVTQSINSSQELSFQIVCSIAALEKIHKPDFY